MHCQQIMNKICFFANIKKRGFLRVFCVRCQLGLSAPSPDTKDFSGKVLWNPKSFAKQIDVFGVKFLRIFKGLFTKSPLKQGLERSSNILRQIKKRGIAAFFVGVIGWGVCPKPRHKGLFVKSPLEPQKLYQNKVVYSVGNSFAYFSYKKSTVAHLSPKERCVRKGPHIL